MSRSIPAELMPRETDYGVAKRLEFYLAHLAGPVPRRVLDVGCGTGASLTAPLAAAFPETEFVGVDSDPESIAFARSRFQLPNLAFCLPSELGRERQFDVVSASEVLEHVDPPGAFLRDLAGRLSDDGRMLITVPNGYGPFELAALAEVAAGAVARSLRGRAPAGAAPCADGGAASTLAVSPHVNFFTQRRLRKLFNSAGLEVAEYRGRTFLCGFAIGAVVRRLGLVEWNARVADRLPAFAVSDWMFVLRPGGGPFPVRERRTRWSTVRSRLTASRAEL